MDLRSRSRRLQKAVLTLAVALGGLWIFACCAQAASPAWKLLAATGPTNLPPKQSESQRLTIEAEGGTFTLSHISSEGTGTLSFASGFVETTEGSNQVLAFPSEGTFEVGQVISGESIVIGTTITGVSGPGSELLELSNNATATGFPEATAVAKKITGVTISLGAFATGDQISGENIASGTTVTGVSGSTLTLSNFVTGAGTVALVGRTPTAPLPYNAPSSVIQNALEALPGFGPGSISVSGGPGGDTERPYFVDFGGPLVQQDIDELIGGSGGLVGEHAAIHVFTTVPGGPGTGEISINPANIGGAATSGEYTVTLGSLPTGIVTSGPAVGTGWSCPGGSGESTVTCTSTVSVPRLFPANDIIVPIEVKPSAYSTSSASVTITGGNAGSASFEMPIVVSTQQAMPGAQAFWAGAFNKDGKVETQAGGHPYSAQSYFLLNTVRSDSGRIVPAGDPKNVIVDLPPGFGGDPLVTPRCPQSQVALVGTNGTTFLCNSEMSVGVFQPLLAAFGEASLELKAPISNDVPPHGYAAEFTTKIATPLQSLLGSVRSSEDFGIRILAPNNPNFEKIFGSFAALEGFPLGSKGKPFMFNPNNCAEEAASPPVVKIKSQTWQKPDIDSITANQVLPPVTGCDQLTFNPGFSFQPTTTQGSSGTGATAHLHIPQDGLSDPGKLATPDLKRAVVTLPPGLTLNPSSASGLEGCSEAQIGYMGGYFELPNPMRFDEAAPSCPDGSKLGTVEISTPLLEAPLQGTIYLAAQEENPFGSLIAIYLIIDDARTGVVLKLPGEVRPDPATGRLTATFDYNPQLPFEDMTLNFRGGGPRSELATPEVCGSYATTGSWTPWSAPESGPPAPTSDGFTVSGNCASSPGTRPFAPSFEAGTTGTKAGAYSPLTIKVARKDGEQELTRLDFTLPEGLTGKLAGIAYCSEAAIKAAEGRSGKAEQANSSCPSASRLGSVDTAAGVGSEPFHVGGNVYLAGPYKGAPVSSVVITPAVAGPFDLGNVVVRAPIYVNSETAQLTVKSDPIPTILRGLSLKVRSVAVSIDRSDFIINPTSCEPMSASANIGSSDGAAATPSNRFQIGDCDALKFTPKLRLALKGGTKRNSNPALVATLTQPAGQANIGRVSVALPHSEFLAQSHIRTVCTRVQFAANACPSGAIYGEAEAITPLLDQPLKGPVYLRSSSNKLPDLVVALRGPESQPIEVDLDGRVDSVNGGIRNTFDLVPDAPVSKFVLRMQGGKKGLVVNSTNICQGSHKATVKMEGQNGRVHNFSSPLKAKCSGKPRHKRSFRHRRRTG
jgi:hypothetical protein